jgi:hypothetical protein
MVAVVFFHTPALGYGMHAIQKLCRFICPRSKAKAIKIHDKTNIISVHCQLGWISKFG